MEYKTKISIVGKTDMGRVRTNNEDAFVAQKIWDDNTYLAIAIDGVGGYEGGEIAAAMAQKTIPEYLSASSNGERVELLKQAVTAANNAIFEAREADSEHGQMSCVLTAAIVDVEHRQISMAHVGDSRLYSFHVGKLKKLSHDHSLIGYREEIGDLTEEEAMHHPQRNVIGRDVGSQKHKASDEDFIEAQVFPLLPNTTLLFCSDGLTDLVTSATITMILEQEGKLEEKADALIKAALEAGGKDNVTVVLFEYLSDEPEMIPAETVTIKEEKPMENNKENVVTDIQKVSENPSKKSWVKAILPLVAGLLVGFVVTYLCLNAKIKENTDEFEVKEKCYIDSIAKLNKSIDALKTENSPLFDSIMLARPTTIEQIETLNQLNQELNGQLKTLNQLNQQLNGQLNKANDENANLKIELSQLKKEIYALQEVLKKTPIVNVE